MKKSVLALAVLGAFAGAASAQSSVTMFGVIDLNVQTIDNDERTYSMGTDGMSSSRLGFRGVEDLGGGLKAGFWLEMGFAGDTGGASGSWVRKPGGDSGTLNGNNTAAGDGNRLFFNRRATVSLSNQWGELRLGRDYTPTFWNLASWDPFGTNGVGNAGNLFLSQGLRTELAGGATYGTLVRANNMVSYILPSGQFGPGLYGQVSVAAGENANGNKYYGGRIGYAAGPFDVSVAYAQSPELLAGSDIDATVYGIGGAWNFGFMKLSGYYGKIEVDGLRDLGPLLNPQNQNDAGRENWYIGVSAPFGQWNFKASYGATNGKDAFNNDDASQWALGVDYNLSKRTAIYAAWASIDNDNNSQFVVSNQGSFLQPGQNSQGGQIGIRHSF